MAMKELFRKMEPMPLYIILTLTAAFFVTELILSHVTHALTLLMDSYHMLCNILALTGCIITIKYGKNADKEDFQPLKQSDSVASSVGEVLTTAQHKRENKLKNTFGWARIDVIFMLICCVFLASLSFSIFVEALQTLAHIDHHDEMHYPISVLCIGCAGLLLNAICYLLIGGYTFHQGSFLYVTESGDVVLNKIVVNQSLQQGGRRLSRTKSIHSSVLPPKQREGLWEMIRDINGCILVIICALFIYFTDKNLAKYIDPLISMISATFMMILSYPYMKESCLILLQTMPDSINIDSLKADLLQHFPDIVNVHDFHVWQLTASKVISTVHMIFQNPKVYGKIKDDVKEFFTDRGITQVTIQPEFFKKNDSMESLISNKFGPNCLMACQNEVCKQNHCCPDYEEKSLFKTTSKEVLSGNQTPDLKSVRTVDDEVPLTTHSISSSSMNSLRNNVEEERNEVNKSLNEIREQLDLKTIKFIDENEAKIENKIDRVLKRDNEVINNQSEDKNDEESRLNVPVGEKDMPTCADEKSLFKTTSKEVLSGNQTPVLKSVQTVDGELPLTRHSISSSSMNCLRNNEEKERTEINKSLNQIREPLDLKTIKFIDENEAKIDEKIYRVLKRDNEVLSNQSNDENNEESRLNVPVEEEDIPTCANVSYIDHDENV